MLLLIFSIAQGVTRWLANKSHRHLVLILGPVLLIGTATAQSSVLDAYIAEGVRSNLALKQENFANARQVEALREARGLFMPQVSFGATYTRAGGGRTIDLPLGDLLNPVYQTLNQMTASDQFPTLANQSEQFLPDDFHDTRVRLVQPLFNPDILFNYRAQQNMANASKAKREAYEQELVKEITVAYYQFLQTREALLIYQNSRELLEEVLRVNKKLVQRDKATPDAVYGVEYELSKLDQEETDAQKNHDLAVSYFNFLLNRDLNTSVMVDSVSWWELQYQPTTSLETQQGLALGSRKELSQLQSSIQATEQQLKINRFRALPTLNVVADLGYQGFGYSFDENQDYWLVQFGLNWDLFKGFQRKSQTRQTELRIAELKSQEEALEQQIQLQVQQAYLSLRAAEKSSEAAEAALKSVSSQFKVAKRRHEEAQLPYFQLLQVRTDLTLASLNQSITRCELLIRQVELQAALGTLNIPRS